MAGPDDDDTDLNEDASAARGLAAFRERMKTSAPDGTVDVEDEPEPDDLDETPEAPGRQDKRSARNSERRSSRERAAAAEARAQVLQEQLEAERRRPAQTQQLPQQQGNPVGHIDAQIKDTFKQEKALAERWQRESAKASPAEIAAMEDEAADINVRRMTLVAERRETLTAPARVQQAEYEAQRARHPDVYGNESALQYARGEYNKRLATGENPSQQMADDCMQEARERVLGKRPAPDKATRQRASGMGGGARPAPGAEKMQISMPRGSELDLMARAAYPDLPPEQARQKWANKAGRRFVVAQSARRGG